MARPDAHTRGITALVAESDTRERQRVYRSAGVHLRYERTDMGEKVTACLPLRLFRVGGGLCHLRHARPSSIWRLDQGFRLPSLSLREPRGRGIPPGSTAWPVTSAPRDVGDG